MNALTVMKYNTRIAPSPTGDMHIGTARTAYLNWLALRRQAVSFTFALMTPTRLVASLSMSKSLRKH